MFRLRATGLRVRRARLSGGLEDPRGRPKKALIESERPGGARRARFLRRPQDAIDVPAGPLVLFVRRLLLLLGLCLLCVLLEPVKTNSRSIRESPLISHVRWRRAAVSSDGHEKSHGRPRCGRAGKSERAWVWHARLWRRRCCVDVCRCGVGPLACSGVASGAGALFAGSGAGVVCCGGATCAAVGAAAGPLVAERPLAFL